MHGALVACALLLGCANEASSGVPKPVAPTMQTLNAYVAPTAPLTLAAAGEILPQAAALITAVDALGIERTFIQSLRAGLAQLEHSRAAAVPPQNAAGGLSVQRQALTLQGDGFAEIERICDGWGVAPVVSPDNGTLHATVGFTERGLDPVVWGTMTACRYRTGERLVQLDGTSLDRSAGDVRMFIGNNVQLATLGSFPDPVLVELATRAVVDGVEVTGSLAFRIDVNTRAVELLVPVAGGYVLVLVDAARGGFVRARASNGTFTCELATRRCTGPNGEALSAP
jgi:hypothetical protein